MLCSRSSWGDLAGFSVDRFRAKIESYADGGGDGGLTRSTMRLACGLQQEPVAPVSTGGAAASVLGDTSAFGAGAVDLEVESLGSRPLPFSGEEDKMLRHHVALLKNCLNEGVDICSEYQVSRLPLDVWPRVKAKDRVSILQHLKTMGFWRELPSGVDLASFLSRTSLWLEASGLCSGPLNLSDLPVSFRRRWCPMKVFCGAKTCGSSTI